MTGAKDTVSEEFQSLLNHEEYGELKSRLASTITETCTPFLRFQTQYNLSLCEFRSGAHQEISSRPNRIVPLSVFTKDATNLPTVHNDSWCCIEYPGHELVQYNEALMLYENLWYDLALARLRPLFHFREHLPPDSTLRIALLMLGTLIAQRNVNHDDTEILLQFLSSERKRMNALDESEGSDMSFTYQLQLKAVALLRSYGKTSKSEKASSTSEFTDALALYSRSLHADLKGITASSKGNKLAVLYSHIATSYTILGTPNLAETFLYQAQALASSASLRGVMLFALSRLRYDNQDYKNCLSMLRHSSELLPLNVQNLLYEALLCCDREKWDRRSNTSAVEMKSEKSACLNKAKKITAVLVNELDHKECWLEDAECAIERSHEKIRQLQTLYNPDVSAPEWANICVSYQNETALISAYMALRKSSFTSALWHAKQVLHQRNVNIKHTSRALLYCSEALVMMSRIPEALEMLLQVPIDTWVKGSKQEKEWLDCDSGLLRRALALLSLCLAFEDETEKAKLLIQATNFEFSKPVQRFIDHFFQINESAM